MNNANTPPAWANPSAAATAPYPATAVVGQQPQPHHHLQQQQQPPAGPETGDDHELALFSDKTYSTLDEPVRETIMRDVRSVASKLKIVLKPLDRSMAVAHYMMVSQRTEDEQQQDAAVAEQQQGPNLSDNEKAVIQSLKDWDLWGPLVLCLSLAVILSFRAPTDQASLVFAAVFCTVWAGSAVVTINAQLLGGTISFFQSLCVLCYSIFPLTLAALVIGIMKIVIHTWMWLDMIVVLVGFIWALRASSVFISLYIKRERRFLALYPVFFFYVFLSWMILLF